MKRIFYIDFLRIISMLSVVMLHACASKLRAGLDFNWQVVNLITSFATCSVPIFFMISGSLLLRSDSTADLNKLWKKRLPKLFFPFLIWSIINIFGYGLASNKFSFDAAVVRIIQIPSRPAEISLWFMYPLMMMYVLSPVFLLIAKRQKLLKYVLIIWVLFVVLLPSLGHLIPRPFNLIFYQNRNWRVIGGFAGYFLLGYYLSKIKLDKISFAALISTFIVAIITIAEGTYWYTIRYHHYDETFKGYNSLYVMVLATAFFLICRKIQDKYPRGLIKLFELIVPASYGVYLIHNLVILYLIRRVPFFFDKNNLTVIFYLFICASLISIVIIYVLGLIPVLGKYLTGVE